MEHCTCVCWNWHSIMFVKNIRCTYLLCDKQYYTYFLFILVSLDINQCLSGMLGQCIYKTIFSFINRFFSRCYCSFRSLLPLLLFQLRTCFCVYLLACDIEWYATGIEYFVFHIFAHVLFVFSSPVCMYSGDASSIDIRSAWKRYWPTDNVEAFKMPQVWSKKKLSVLHNITFDNSAINSRHRFFNFVTFATNTNRTILAAWSRAYFISTSFSVCVRCLCCPMLTISFVMRDRHMSIKYA